MIKLEHPIQRLYLAEPSGWDPTPAYRDVSSRGYFVRYDLHAHPDGYFPPGFSEDDTENLPIDVPYAVLLEDRGACVRYYYAETGGYDSVGTCRS